MILVRNRPIGLVGIKVILVRFWYVWFQARGKPARGKYTKSLKSLRFKALVNSTLMELDGDKRDRTADLLNAIQALSRVVGIRTPRILPLWRTLEWPEKPCNSMVFRHYGSLTIGITGAEPFTVLRLWRAAFSFVQRLAASIAVR